ncbi:transglutaminase family protein [Phyllobacterium leguminum]|uniref:Transglutaminase-like putative cysteine protease n=1 Tax=Phyllobacterium leguminum TaxID=314237 RepID=A0A318T1B1_9HYPH|nr:transglutaminase family protein [Phyllobacterium leguminum]PYE88267.1 transglutaminase-like putative cysteine protease [Phyllobacterium leguminum]
MLLTIRHVSHYQYDFPVPYAVQRLRLRPQTTTGQKVAHWQLTVDGAEPEVSYTDGYGNKVDLVRHDRNANEITITATGQIETEDRAGVMGETGGYAPLWLFMRKTLLTQPGEALRGMAADIPAGGDRLAVLHALMNTIHAQVAYVPGATDVETDAESALRNGKGVCQDHAHIFISAARLLDIPARYVSGYLMMDGVIDQTASHAWAEAHVAGLGWIGFDAANDICPNERYVRIACGLDYRDAAPISGMRFGSAAERLAVEINVEQ